MDIGKRIRTMREYKNWTQKTLGEKCTPPIAESTIRRYELGKLNPKIDSIQKIATALEIPVSVLLDLDEPASRAQLLYQLLGLSSKIPISLNEFEYGKMSITFDDFTLNSFLFEWFEHCEISKSPYSSDNYLDEWVNKKLEMLKFPHDEYTKYILDEDVD